MGLNKRINDWLSFPGAKKYHFPFARGFSLNISTRPPVEDTTRNRKKWGMLMKKEERKKILGK
jgi:hypothetical protein